MEFGVVDMHAHIFPPLSGASGFADAATHLMHQQRAMHVHANQPYRRARDHAATSTRPLWQADDPTEAGRARDVGFRVGRCGRFEWEAEGESFYVQFLPPAMADLSQPAEVAVRQMDYAGIACAVLQNDHIYGNLAAEFAQAQAAFPGRFIGLAQIEEAWAWREVELLWLEQQVTGLGMRGLYFTTAGLFRNGYRTLPSDAAFTPLWRAVERLQIPIFWVHSARSPIGNYEDEMRHLAAIVERHPSIRHVLVHGVPTALFAGEDGMLRLPATLERLLKEASVTAEILYPIGCGGRLDYPYAAVLPQIRQLLERFGPERFAWGSDMPNVERYCTYRQSLGYLWKYADFLGPEERRLMFRENALGLFAPNKAERVQLD